MAQLRGEQEALQAAEEQGRKQQRARKLQEAKDRQARAQYLLEVQERAMKEELAKVRAEALAADEKEGTLGSAEAAPTRSLSMLTTAASFSDDSLDARVSKVVFLKTCDSRIKRHSDHVCILYITHTVNIHAHIDTQIYTVNTIYFFVYMQ